MKSHALSSTAGSLSHRPHESGVRPYRFIMDRFLLLPVGALVALVWANAESESYYRVAHALAFPVNHIAMAFFLALIGQDVADALVPGGALHSWRQWSLALVAAAGGMAGSAGLYYAYVAAAHETVLTSAWPAAVAVDIAGGYYLLRTICRPRSPIIPFLVIVAGATDLGALMIQAAWRPYVTFRPIALTLLVVALALAVYLRRSNRQSVLLYVAVCGVLSWVSLYLAGVDPVLALLPLVPFLPHEARRGDIFAEPDPDDEWHVVEHSWHEAVQLVLFFFGLVNAGVLWTWYDTGTWATLAGALVGRPLGILAAIALAVALGLQLPRAMRWREMVVAALATSSGFTFALLFATSFVPPGAVLAQVKMGALLTVFGALVTVGAARLLGVGRRRRPATR